MLDPRRLSAALDATGQAMAASGYSGYDPYDGLTSPLFGLPIMRSSRLVRFGFQQVLKRLPFQTRRLFRIRRGYNPVTLALAAQGLTARDRASRTTEGRRADEVRRLVEELAELQVEGFSGACWGYDFPWQSRYSTFPAGHPTVVATGFVTNALYLIWRHYGVAQARDLCLSAAGFVANDLNRIGHGDSFCWSYSPTDRQVVLNATMKGARLLAQAVDLGADRALLDDAAATIRYVVAHQAGDGSWPYAVGDSRSWADHFHTCYNLDCLDEYQRLSGDTAFAPALTRGLEYYLDHFFTTEGIPRYYDRETYPIDSTCCGQALLTLARFGQLVQAGRTAEWILEHMAHGDGQWKYRIYRRFENRLPYMRWSMAWIFAGLASLEEAMSRCSSDDDRAGAAGPG